MKVRLGKKKQVNELLGGLFSRGGTTSKTKGLDAKAAAQSFNQLKQNLEAVDQKIGKEKLKKLGLSMTDLYHMIDQSTKIFSGGVGAVRSLGMNKTQNAINLMKQDYDDVVKYTKSKQLTSQEANEIITGIINLARIIYQSMPAMMEENNDKLDEAFGMQKKKLYGFLQSLKHVDDEGNPASVTDPSAAAQAAMRQEPPPPPTDSQPTKVVEPSAISPAAPKTTKIMSPEEKQDKINTYSKMASKYVQNKLNKMITPEDAKKVVELLMNKNYLKESGEYDNLLSTVSKETGLDIEIVKAIFDSLQNSFSGELQKLHFDKEREQFSGMGTNESLNENLIERKKQELFTEIDAKRYKLLAGLL